jgi:hypothetical protein
VDNPEDEGAHTAARQRGSPLTRTPIRPWTFPRRSSTSHSASRLRGDCVRAADLFEPNPPTDGMSAASYLGLVCLCLLVLPVLSRFDGLNDLFNLDKRIDWARQRRIVDRRDRHREEYLEAEANLADDAIHFPPNPSAWSAAYVSTNQGSPVSVDVKALRFENLSEQELEDHYTAHTSTQESIVDSVRSLSSKFTHSTLVDIMLVGFAGDGEASLTLESNELMRYLAQAGLTDEQVLYSLKSLEGGNHALPFTSKHLFRINKAHPSLRAEIQQMLQSTVDALVESNPYVIEAAEQNRHATSSSKKPGSPKPLVLPTIPIPVHMVNSLVEENFKSLGGVGQMAIYLINLAPIYLKEEAKEHKDANGAPMEKQKVRLRYVYTQDHVAPSNLTSATYQNHQSPCPTTHWISSTSRLAWFDLSAGPISYGPQSWGDGQSTAHATAARQSVDLSVTFRSSLCPARFGLSPRHRHRIHPPQSLPSPPRPDSLREAHLESCTPAGREWRTVEDTEGHAV